MRAYVYTVLQHSAGSLTRNRHLLLAGTALLCALGSNCLILIIPPETPEVFWPLLVYGEYLTLPIIGAVLLLALIAVHALFSRPINSSPIIRIITLVLLILIVPALACASLVDSSFGMKTLSLVNGDAYKTDYPIEYRLTFRDKLDTHRYAFYECNISTLICHEIEFDQKVWHTARAQLLVAPIDGTVYVLDPSGGHVICAYHRGKAHVCVVPPEDLSVELTRPSK